MTDLIVDMLAASWHILIDASEITQYLLSLGSSAHVAIPAGLTEPESTSGEH